MATPTYELIETTTLSSSVSSVTFSSITQDYRDLIVVASMQNRVFPSLNPTGASLNVDNVRMWGDGSSTNTNVRTEDPGSGTFTACNFVIWQLMDYSATDKFKTMIVRGNRPTEAALAQVSMWKDTSPITGFTIDIAGNNAIAGDTFSVYGIAA